MANSTLLSLFQTTMQGMGVATYGNPTSVIGNTNQDVVQTLALVNIAGDELLRQFEWQQATKQYIFSATYFSYTGDPTSGSTTISGMSSVTSLDTTFMVTGTGIPQDTFVTAVSSPTVTINQAATATGNDVTLTFSKVLFALPSDFDRMVDYTQWDKGKHWNLLGPLTAQQREWIRNGYISTGPRIRFWQMGGYVQIWPPLGADETLSYEYISKYWVLATSPTTPAPTKQAFAVDTDTSIYPDALMRAMIKLKYWEVKGFDVTAAVRDYMIQIDAAKATDQGAPNLSMAPQPSTVLIGWGNIPDSGYGT
jgi:hypothetical protein